jgi:glycosyltransferase involved in cell wall biosynthesis
MNQYNPLISVIIPVFNGAKYLGGAIESVLAQNDFRLDVIIVDDGSTDDTAKVSKSYGSSVRYYYQMNAGPAAARNYGITSARGEYFAFLDADDLWTADKTRRQWLEFEAKPELDMVFSHIENFYSPDLTQAEKDQIDIPVIIMPGYHAGAMLIKKAVFLAVGLFKNELRIGEFIDWYARAQELNLNSIMLPDILMKRRIHRTNLGISQRDQRSGYVHALKAALDRRRAKV